MRGRYETNGKRMIIDFLKKNKEHHFSIEQISEGISSEEKAVSVSTVYRQIPKLIESGEVRRFEAHGSKQFVYQYSDFHDGCEMHFHLKCRNCGRLFHMECEKMESLKQHILESHGFIIGGEAVINGICEECHKKEGECRNSSCPCRRHH